MKPQLIITGVSWSWKSTIMNNLIRAYPDMYGKPIQYTTRKQRSDIELDEYVFLTHSQFMTKLLNWDFVEYVEYNKELYAISKYFNKNKCNIFIAEPVWREALKRHFNLSKTPYISTYIMVDKPEIEKRLHQRWMTVNTIETRLTDFDYFHSSSWDKIIQWEHKQESIVSSIHKYIQWALYQT